MDFKSRLAEHITIGIQLRGIVSSIVCIVGVKQRVGASWIILEVNQHTGVGCGVPQQVDLAMHLLPVEHMHKRHLVLDVMRVTIVIGQVLIDNSSVNNLQIIMYILQLPDNQIVISKV